MTTNIVLWAFKETRKKSAVKHTGLIFFSSIKARWFRVDYGPSSGGSMLTSGAIFARHSPLHFCVELLGDVYSVDGLEEKYRAAKFAMDNDEWETLLKKHFVPDDYCPVTNNCRDYCKKVFAELKRKGINVSDKPRTLIDKTARNDALVVGGSVALASALMVGAVKLYEVWNPPPPPTPLELFIKYWKVTVPVACVLFAILFWILLDIRNSLHLLILSQMRPS